MISCSNSPVSVFWDVDNLQIPNSFEGEISQVVRRALIDNGYKGKISIFAKGVLKRMSSGSRYACESNDINFNTVLEGKNATDIELINDIWIWADMNPPPATVMLMSGDGDFANTLHKLTFRGYNIITVQNNNPVRTISSAAAAAQSQWDWVTLLSY